MRPILKLWAMSELQTHLMMLLERVFVEHMFIARGERGKRTTCALIALLLLRYNGL